LAGTRWDRDTPYGGGKLPPLAVGQSGKTNRAARIDRACRRKESWIVQEPETLGVYQPGGELLVPRETVGRAWKRPDLQRYSRVARPPGAHRAANLQCLKRGCGKGVFIRMLNSRPTPMNRQLSTGALDRRGSEHPESAAGRGHPSSQER
jgi:hypothetical protein